MNINERHYPHLKGLSVEEILVAADRWQALKRMDVLQVKLAQGFTDEEIQKDPASRELLLRLAVSPTLTQPQFDSAMVKLKDITDLVRGRSLEDLLESEHTHSHQEK